MQPIRKWCQAAALPSLWLVLATLVALPAHAAQVNAADVIFGEVEKRLIREYFASHGGGTAYSGERDDHQRAGKGHGKNKHAKHGKHGKKHKKKHGHGHAKGGLPPGLAKKGRLPPGLAKRRRLPPGLEKRRLPAGLYRELPAPRPGTERVMIDNNVVLIQKATGVVLDILMDAIEQAK